MLHILSTDQREHWPWRLGSHSALGRAEDLCPAKCEGTVLFTRFVAASLDVLLIPSKSPISESWLQGPWSGWWAALGPGFRSKGRAEQREHPSAWERCLYTPVVLLSVGSGVKPDSPGVYVKSSCPVPRCCADLQCFPQAVVCSSKANSPTSDLCGCC